MNPRGKKGKLVPGVSCEVDEEPLHTKVIKSSILLLKGVTSKGITSFGIVLPSIEVIALKFVESAFRPRTLTFKGLGTRRSLLN